MLGSSLAGYLLQHPVIDLGTCLIIGSQISLFKSNVIFLII